MKSFITSGPGHHFRNSALKRNIHIAFISKKVAAADFIKEVENKNAQHPKMGTLAYGTDLSPRKLVNTLHVW